MMIYKGNLRNLQNKIELTNEFSNVAGNNVHIQKYKTNINKVNFKKYL